MFSGLLSHSAAPAADFSRLQRASITFRDVAKRYGDHQVLNAINLQDRKSKRLNSSHIQKSRMPSSA